MFQIEYDPRVREIDFQYIPKKDWEKIHKAIYKRLSKEPEEAGKILHGALKDCYRLRFSKYRVIYKIEHKRIVVYVFAIGYRHDDEIYRIAAKRLGMVD